MQQWDAIVRVIEGQQATIDRQMGVIENVVGQLAKITEQLVTPTVVLEPVRPEDIYGQPTETEEPILRDPADLEWPDIESLLAGQTVEGFEED